ncbi:MAG: hypothetical protein ACETWQ_12390 [Phycisphaerae bacterium]
MNKKIENIDRYLKDVVPPEHMSHQHRQQLRREVLKKIERRQTMFVRKRSWKVAAVLAVVLGLGAIAVVGVNIGRYYYYGKNDDGHHMFISEDRETFVTMDADEVTDVEQTRRDLEEMELLKQQGKRELLRVIETIIGTYRLKTHEYRYQLSDGRTEDMGENADDMPVYNVEQWKEFGQQLEEFRRLRKGGPGEDLGTYEQTVEGRVFSFKRERYFLSDGTEAIRSVGTPKEDQ